MITGEVYWVYSSLLSRIRFMNDHWSPKEQEDGFTFPGPRRVLLCSPKNKSRFGVEKVVVPKTNIEDLVERSIVISCRQVVCECHFVKSHTTWESPHRRVARSKRFWTSVETWLSYPGHQRTQTRLGRGDRSRPPVCRTVPDSTWEFRMESL